MTTGGREGAHAVSYLAHHAKLLVDEVLTECAGFERAPGSTLSDGARERSRPRPVRSLVRWIPGGSARPSLAPVSSAHGSTATALHRQARDLVWCCQAWSVACW